MASRISTAWRTLRWTTSSSSSMSVSMKRSTCSKPHRRSWQCANRNSPSKPAKKEPQHAVSAELDETAPATEVEPNEEMIAQGYDEAVEQGVPFQAEQNILAADSADRVALSEADPMTTGEL